MSSIEAHLVGGPKDGLVYAVPDTEQVLTFFAMVPSPDKEPDAVVERVAVKYVREDKPFRKGCYRFKIRKTT